MCALKSISLAVWLVEFSRNAKKRPDTVDANDRIDEIRYGLLFAVCIVCTMTAYTTHVYLAVERYETLEIVRIAYASYTVAVVETIDKSVHSISYSMRNRIRKRFSLRYSSTRQSFFLKKTCLRLCASLKM